ncbi:hypothetical protein FRC07_010953 [Ceratobasidium sp. 392]|nr:hypothetical protein FRC07_010953 [Ceratobasidium sp. 392]
MFFPRRGLAPDAHATATAIDDKGLKVQRRRPANAHNPATPGWRGYLPIDADTQPSTQSNRLLPALAYLMCHWGIVVNPLIFNCVQYTGLNDLTQVRQHTVAETPMGLHRCGSREASATSFALITKRPSANDPPSTGTYPLRNVHDPPTDAEDPQQLGQRPNEADDPPMTSTTPQRRVNMPLQKDQ